MSVSYLDLAGVTRSKPVLAGNVDSLLREGVKTAKANLDMNAVAPLTPGSRLDISQGDVRIVPVPETLVFPDYAPDTARMIGELVEADGTPSPYCARSLLSRELAKAERSGRKLVAGFEGEFHEIVIADGRPIPADDSGIQTQAGFDQHRELLSQMVGSLRAVDVTPVKAHVEGGRGQLEVDVAPEPGMKAADGLVYFKDVVKGVSRRHGLVASFMPKIGADWWGSGLHVHLNLLDRRGTNVFSGGRGSKQLGLSDEAIWFIGGLLRHMRALCAIGAPSVNSYRRLLPGRWNADAVAYGPGNRGAAIRIPDERGQQSRIEMRMPDATCNQYLLLACASAAGSEGIEKKLDPGEPLLVDASKMSDDELVDRGLKLMPRSIGEALSELKNDQLLRRTMGRQMSEEFLAQRYFEMAQSADQVTQWEVSHFLDLF